VRAITLSSILVFGLALAAAARGEEQGAAAPADASAAPAASLALDTSKPLRCSLAGAAECDEAAQCSGVELVAIDLPEFWRVDFAAKQLASLDGQRTSPIASVETLDGAILLQGNQEGRGWTLVVDRASGHLGVAAASAEGAFVLAGGCIAE
jgi:hypothetical protein